MQAGVAKKQQEREQRALQEAIDVGMVQLKGLGKKKRRAKEAERRADRGLAEDNGLFRNGKLLVKAPRQGRTARRPMKTTQKR